MSKSDQHSADKCHKPLVSIVMLAYNNLDYTRLCVDSILRHTIDIDYEFIVVNNGSSDGTKEYFDSLSNVKALHLPENVGPVNGFNAGFEIARGKYTAGVCNDFIFTANWLSNMLRCMESDDRIGFVSPGSSCISNYQQINGTYANIEEMQQFAKSYNISDPTKWEERVRLLPNVLMVRTELFKNLGYYDPIFFYGEFADDDFAFRVRRAGYKLIFLRDTFVFHFGSVTTGEDQVRNKSLEVSRKIFQEKYGIDVWEDGKLDPFIVDAIDYDTNRSNVRLLGINTYCGGTPLQIKNRFTAKGTNVTVWNITDDEKYLTDLKTVSDYVAHVKTQELQDALVDEKFDYIILERGYENLDITSKILAVLKEHLAEDGKLLVKVENPFYFRRILPMLKSAEKTNFEVGGGFRKNGPIKDAKSVGFSDMNTLQYKPSIGADIQEVIKTLTKLKIRHDNNPLTEDVFATDYYLYRLAK